MDRAELMALDLETAQQKRYRKFQKKANSDQFWTRDELDIFAFINIMRSRSKTFHPDNRR